MIDRVFFNDTRVLWNVYLLAIFLNFLNSNVFRTMFCLGFEHNIVVDVLHGGFITENSLFFLLSLIALHVWRCTVRVCIKYTYTIPKNNILPFIKMAILKHLKRTRHHQKRMCYAKKKYWPKNTVCRCTMIVFVSRAVIELFWVIWITPIPCAVVCIIFVILLVSHGPGFKTNNYVILHLMQRNDLPLRLCIHLPYFPNESQILNYNMCLVPKKCHVLVRWQKRYRLARYFALFSKNPSLFLNILAIY